VIQVQMKDIALKKLPWNNYEIRPFGRVKLKVTNLCGRICTLYVDGRTRSESVGVDFVNYDVPAGSSVVLDIRGRGFAPHKKSFKGISKSGVYEAPAIRIPDEICDDSDKGRERGFGGGGVSFCSAVAISEDFPETEDDYWYVSNGISPGSCSMSHASPSAYYSSTSLEDRGYKKGMFGTSIASKIIREISSDGLLCDEFGSDIPDL
jgi:hypothetical protein